MKLDSTVYRKLFALFRPYPRMFGGLIIMLLLSTLTEGLGIGIVLPLLDTSLINSDLFQDVPLLGRLAEWTTSLSFVGRVRLAAVALFVIVMMRTIFAISSNLVGIRLQLNAERDLEFQTYQQLHDIQLSFVHGQKMGELLNLFNYHVAQIGFMLESLVTGISFVFTLTVYTMLALVVSWELTLVTLFLLLLIAWIAKSGFSARIKATGDYETEKKGELRAMTLESLLNLKLLHIFGKEDWNIARLRDALETSQNAVYASKQTVAYARYIVVFISLLLICTLLFASTIFFPQQLEAWLARLIVFLIIAFRLLNPIATVNLMNSQIINRASRLDELSDFLDRADKPYLVNGTQQAKTLQQAIQFDNVTFCYDKNEPPVLENVSFTIKKGEMTAIVGPSGAGKSSIVNLITRLYDCDQGQIEIDGVDIRSLDVTSWRRQLAVVSQDTFVFNATVRSNLQFASESATHAQLEQAAKLAQAHDFIMALPEQYDTILGDRGVRLSGGQQQRITIARAIAANPKLLIFDEATSDLDTETEQALQAAISNYGRDRTMLVIAHRLSTIREADNIVVLDRGKVVEQGTHQQLMAHGGVYRRLVEMQWLDRTNA